MDMPGQLKEITLGAMTEFAARLVGADIDLLRQSPRRDAENINAIALLLLAAMAFQASEFSVIAHVLFAPDDGIHLLLIAASVGIAGLIAMLDAYTFVRSAFYADGIKELRRGGIDLG